MIPTTANHKLKIDDTKAYYGYLPANLYAGKLLIFFGSNILEHQCGGDAKAPLLRVFDSNKR